MGAVGRCTPLGAIYASSENLTGLLSSLFKMKLKEADHETILRAFNLSEKFSKKGALVSSREERQQVRELSTFIENSEIIGNHGLKYARELVECGITTDDADSLEIIFNLPDYAPVCGIFMHIYHQRWQIFVQKGFPL